MRRRYAILSVLLLVIIIASMIPIQQAQALTAITFTSKATISQVSSNTHFQRVYENGTTSIIMLDGDSAGTFYQRKYVIATETASSTSTTITNGPDTINSNAVFSPVETTSHVWAAGRATGTGKNVIALRLANDLSAVNATSVTSTSTPFDIVQSKTKLYTPLRTSGSNLDLGSLTRAYASYAEVSLVTGGVVNNAEIRSVVYDGSPDTIYTFYQTSGGLRAVKYTSSATILSTVMTHTSGSEYQIAQLSNKILIQTSAAFYELNTSTDAITQIYSKKFNTLFPQTFTVNQNARTFNSNAVYIADSTEAINYIPSTGVSSATGVMVEAANGSTGALTHFAPLRYYFLTANSFTLELAGSLIATQTSSGNPQTTVDTLDIQGEKFTSTSSFLGKPFDSITVRLAKVGSPTATVTIAIYNTGTGTTVKKLFGTISSSSLTTDPTYTDYTFSLSNDIYSLEANDVVGVECAACAGVNYVKIQFASDGTFDGTNSLMQTRDQTSWYGNPYDLYMILDYRGGWKVKSVGTQVQITNVPYSERLGITLAQNSTLFNLDVLKLVCGTGIYEPTITRFAIGSDSDCTIWRTLDESTSTIGRQLNYARTKDLVHTDLYTFYNFHLSVASPTNYSGKLIYGGKDVDQGNFDAAGNLQMRMLYGQCYTFQVTETSTSNTVQTGNICADDVFSKGISLTAIVIPPDWLGSLWSHSIVRHFDNSTNQWANATNNHVIITVEKQTKPYNVYIHIVDNTDNVITTQYDVSTGSTTYNLNSGGTILAGETVTSVSALNGDQVNSVTIALSKTGSPTGTAYVGVWSNTVTPTSSNYKHLFGTISAASLTGSPVSYTFTKPTHYTLTTNDVIGVFFSGGSGGNSVDLTADAANPFDGTNSYISTYAGSWAIATGQDIKASFKIKYLTFDQWYNFTNLSTPAVVNITGIYSNQTLYMTAYDVNNLPVITDVIQGLVYQFGTYFSGFGRIWGVPVGAIFILIVASVWRRDNAHIGIMVTAATTGIMVILGFFTLDPVFWALGGVMVAMGVMLGIKRS